MFIKQLNESCSPLTMIITTPEKSAMKTKRPAVKRRASLSMFNQDDGFQGGEAPASHIEAQAQAEAEAKAEAEAEAASQAAATAAALALAEATAASQTPAAPVSSPAKIRQRTASNADSGEESDDELKEAYVNCVAASDLPDVKGFRGSINPYVIIKWDGEEVKKSPSFVDNQKPRFDTFCRISIGDAEETATLVIELYDKVKGDTNDTHVSSIEITRDELIEFCNDGEKKPRTMAFTGVPGSKVLPKPLTRHVTSLMSSLTTLS